MNIVLAPIGTLGDIIPFVALAETLAARGHFVKVCGSSLHAGTFQSRGLSFVSVGATISWSDISEMVDRVYQCSTLPEQGEIITRSLLLYEGERMYADYIRAMEDSDIVVCPDLNAIAREAAITAHKVWTSVNLTPFWVESALRYPLPNHLRTYLETTLQRDGLPIKASAPYSPTLNIIAASPVICHISSRLPSHFKVTGAWLPDEISYCAPADLQRFLEVGSPAVVVSFSSVVTLKAKTMDIVIEAIEQLKLRAVVLGCDNKETSSSIFCTKYIPHSYLLPRTSLMVHHAGSGTAHTICRFGKPSVAVPHVLDQFYWAQCLATLGVAPKPMPSDTISVGEVASAIALALEDKAMRARAEQIGSLIRAEHGTEAAADAIETSAHHVESVGSQGPDFSW